MDKRDIDHLSAQPSLQVAEEEEEEAAVHLVLATTAAKKVT